MSYILDALRRAEAERDRGRVPNVHSQPAYPTSSASRDRDDHRQSNKLSWVIIGLLTLTLVGLAAAWRWSSTRKAPEVAAPTQASAPVPSVAMVSSLPPTAAPTSAPPAAVPAHAPAPASSSTPLPATTPSVAVATVPNSTPMAATASTPAMPPARVAKPRPEPTRAAPTASTSPPAASAPPSEALPNNALAIVARHQLPSDVQSRLPPLAMSGSVYSPNPRNRMVIVDGRLVIEGERLTQDLLVERIHPKSVVMRFQQHRFEVPIS